MPNTITWKWVAGVLLAIALTVTGFIFKETDARGLVNTERISKLESAVQEGLGRSAEKFNEILRRIDRLEHAIDKLEETVRNRRF